jgi:hypothetical protein
MALVPSASSVPQSPIMVNSKSSIDSTALTKPNGDRAAGTITTPDEYRQALAQWQQQRWHVVTPIAELAGLAPQHYVVAQRIWINPDPAAGEVYDNSGGFPFLKEGEVALAKNGLRRLAMAGEFDTATRRTDPRTIPYYWEHTARLAYTGLNGRTVTREEPYEWDLRDGSERLRGMSPRQIAEARKHGARNCAARAQNAVIREIGLRQKYTRAELAKPFVVCRVAFLSDAADPEQMRQLQETALRGRDVLYSQTRELAPGAVIDVDPDPQSDAPAQSSASSAAPVDPNAPPTADAVRIMDVKSHSGKRKDGSAWTRYVIIDSRGEEHSTFDRSIAEFADKARLAKQWVEVAVEVNGLHKNLVEITAAGEQPHLPDVGAL